VQLAVGQRESMPVLGEIRAWLDSEKPNLLPKSPSGQATTYFENRWVALNRYCESVILTIDNNKAERTLKPIAIGHKNRLFVGSKLGGERPAVLKSLVQTCKRNEVEPWVYLRRQSKLVEALARESLYELPSGRCAKANP
jgi:transposase